MEPGACRCISRCQNPRVRPVKRRRRTGVTGHGGGSRRTCLCLLTRALGSCLPAIHGRFSLSFLEILHAPSSASLFTPSSLGRSLASCLTVMEREKRKRDDDAGTIVTFYAPDRAFSRVYKGAFSHCVLPLPLLLQPVLSLLRPGMSGRWVRTDCDSYACSNSRALALRRRSVTDAILYDANENMARL